MSMAVVAVPSRAAEAKSPASCQPSPAGCSPASSASSSAAAPARAVRTMSGRPPGALSSDHDTEPRKAKNPPAASAAHSHRSAVSRRNTAARAVRPSAVRKWTRKKRGLIRAGFRIKSEPIRPKARRRQNRASMKSPRAVNQGHQLRAGGLVFLEDAAHGAGGGDAARLADAADRHAGVRRLDDDADAAGA